MIKTEMQNKLYANLLTIIYFILMSFLKYYPNYDPQYC